MFCQLTIFYYRAIDIQALVGNIGGYIGLFLGYSILQIPGFIVIIFRKVKMFMSRSRKGILTLNPNISFKTKQEGWKNVRSKDDLFGVCRDLRSTTDKISADTEKILTTVQKQGKRIELLEKKISITPKM